MALSSTNVRFFKRIAKTKKHVHVCTGHFNQSNLPIGTVFLFLLLFFCFFVTDVTYSWASAGPNFIIRRLWFTYMLQVCSGTPPVHRGAFWQFPFRWIYYYDSNKSTGKETGKTHLKQDKTSITRRHTPCRCLDLFCKIQVRQRSCRSYPLWRPRCCYD